MSKQKYKTTIAICNYIKTQENFIKIAKELVSKILAIKLFFNQYDTKSNSMKPSLLISNFNPNLLENIVYKKKIEAFLIQE